MTTAEKHEFPMARTPPFAPAPAYEQVREEKPVSRVRLPDGGWAWVGSAAPKTYGPWWTPGGSAPTGSIRTSRSSPRARRRPGGRTRIAS